MTISVTFINDSANKPVVYIDRPDLNQFTLTIQTDSATPVAADQVSIRFPPKIFNADNVKDITVTSTGWNAPRAARTNLTLTPAASLTLSSMSPVVIKLAQVKSGFTAATNDDLLVRAGGEAPSTKVFLMRYPATAGDLTTALLPKLLPERVYRTPDGHSTLENVLQLVITNKSPNTPLVQAAWVRTPTILLSFVYGDDIGSLTPADSPSSDPNSAFNIKIDVEATYKEGEQTYEWTAVPPDKDDGAPTWSLQPVPENVSVLGPQSSADAEFRISGISTASPVGFTQVYLQYSDFPGYNDGYFTLQIKKEEPHPTIIFFDGLPARVAKLNDPVTVKWQTFSVDKVELTFGDTTLSSASGDIDIERGSYTVAIDRTTDFTLSAYDDVADAQPQHSLNWTAHVPNARIIKFSSDKTAVVAGAPVTLSWQTVFARSAEIRISGDTAYPIPNADLDAGSKTYYPAHSVTYTLHVDGESDPPDQQIPVFALAPGWSTRRMGFDPGAIGRPVMLATDSTLIMLAGQSANAIFATNNGYDWSQVGVATFPARNAAAGCAHAGKLWIMGGLNADSNRPSNDVWSSADGLTWTKVTDAAPWSKRSNFACASFKDKLWVMGGLDQNLQSIADIWSSNDGTTWTKASGTPKWAARAGVALASHGARLYLFGGLLANGAVSGELWASDDSVSWTVISRDGDARQQAVMTSIGNSLYMGGGVNASGSGLGDFNIFSGDDWELANAPSALTGLSQTAFTNWRGALWIGGGQSLTASNDAILTYFPRTW